MITTVVAGNPKSSSRTLAAAALVAEQVAGGPADHVVDVIALGDGLLRWGDPSVAAAVETVSRSDLVVVASPTFKATYTGVLKLFLDQVPANGLAGVTAIPLMMGGGLSHTLAPELLLKPVLVELGAVVPVQGLYLGEKTYEEPDALDPWLSRWRPALNASLAASLAAPLATPSRSKGSAA